MTPTYAIAAVNCPSPNVFSGPLISIAANSQSNPPTTPHCIPVNSGQRIITPQIDGAMCRTDLGAGLYTVPFAVLYGLVLSPGSGLNGAVSIGQGNIEGIGEYPGGTLPLSPSTTNYCFLYQSAVQANPTVYVSTVKTLPGAMSCYIGCFTTNASGVTGIDLSGVCIVNNGIVERIVADTGYPSDTPPVGWRGLTLNSSLERWFWTGTQYDRLGNGVFSPDMTSIPVNVTQIIPAGFQKRIFGSFTCNGQLTVNGEFLMA